jgi:hypothetical protein
MTAANMSLKEVHDTDSQVLMSNIGTFSFVNNRN